ncbi:hypothetical protein ACX0GZ_07725 [Sphingomonas aestuarii]
MRGEFDLAVVAAERSIMRRKLAGSRMSRKFTLWSGVAICIRQAMRSTG